MYVQTSTMIGSMSISHVKEATLVIYRRYQMNAKHRRHVYMNENQCSHKSADEDGTHTGAYKCRQLQTATVMEDNTTT